jgi:hypothetical protein
LRLIDTPDSYASLVANRRRRFRDDTSDIVTAVAVPVERIRELLPELPDDLTETGLARMQDGELVTHAMLMGIGRALAAQGLPPGLLTRLMLDAAGTARNLGGAFRTQVEQQDGDDRRLADLA